jgi:hypothetical protein
MPLEGMLCRIQNDLPMLCREGVCLSVVCLSVVKNRQPLNGGLSALHLYCLLVMVGAMVCLCVPSGDLLVPSGDVGSWTFCSGTNAHWKFTECCREALLLACL